MGFFCLEMKDKTRIHSCKLKPDIFKVEARHRTSAAEETWHGTNYRWSEILSLLISSNHGAFWKITPVWITGGQGPGVKAGLNYQ